MLVMRVRVGGSKRIVAFLAMYRLGRPVRQHFRQELFSLQHQSGGRRDMTVAPAMTPFPKSEQHIQAPARQIVTKQAVLEIDFGLFAIRVGHAAPFDKLWIDGLRNDRHTRSSVQNNFPSR